MKKNNDFFKIKKGDIVAIILLVLIVGGVFVYSKIVEKRENERITAQKQEILTEYRNGEYENALTLAEALEDGEDYISLIEGAMAFNNNNYDLACEKLKDINIEDSVALYDRALENNSVMNEINNFNYNEAYRLADNSAYLSNMEAKGYKRRILYETKCFSLIRDWCEINNSDIEKMRMESIMWTVEDVRADTTILHADEDHMTVIFSYNMMNGDNEFYGVITYEDGELRTYGDLAYISSSTMSLYDEYEARTKNLNVTLDAEMYISTVKIHNSSMALDGKHYSWVNEEQTEGLIDNLEGYNSFLDSGEITPISDVVGQ